MIQFNFLLELISILLADVAFKQRSDKYFKLLDILERFKVAETKETFYNIVTTAAYATISFDENALFLLARHYFNLQDIKISFEYVDFHAKM